MSERYVGAWVTDGGFNPLTPPTPSYTYNLFGWGRNNSGQLGLGNTTNYSSPIQVGSLTNWLQLTSGAYYSVAIKTDGTLWTWGNNSAGQLGLGNTTYYSSPKQVGILTNWSSVSAGYNHALAIKTDGTLWSWGNGTFGGLGLGNTTFYSSPKQVGSGTTWSKVCGYTLYSLAIKTDGTLWSWGYNQFGTLGLNNVAYYSSPKQIGSGTTWANIFHGPYTFVLASKTDGTLWGWGYNGYGQLGLGNSTYAYSSPKQIGALTNWKSASGGRYHSTATKTNGTLWSWGANQFGQLGLNVATSTYYSSPKQVGVLTTWSTTSSRYYNSSAIKTDGTLWTWGYGAYGQLGFGNVNSYLSPSQVGALTTWKTVSISFYDMIALAY